MGEFNTVIINLAGGPGSGKSTTAAGVFYELKKRGYVCELVTEFAKDKVWEDSYMTLNDQIYVFGKQFHKMWRLLGKVQFIITDTCLPLSIHFNKIKSEIFPSLVIEQYNSFNNEMYFILRGDTFQQQGRIENEAEAKEVDIDILNIFRKWNIEYKVVKQDTAVQHIINDMVENYGTTD